MASACCKTRGRPAGRLNGCCMHMTALLVVFHRLWCCLRTLRQRTCARSMDGLAFWHWLCSGAMMQQRSTSPWIRRSSWRATKAHPLSFPVAASTRCTVGTRTLRYGSGRPRTTFPHPPPCVYAGPNPSPSTYAPPPAPSPPPTHPHHPLAVQPAPTSPFPCPAPHHPPVANATLLGSLFKTALCSQPRPASALDPL